MDSHESHTSPDGTITLLVSRQPDEITLGFDGYSWHTHGDVLAGEYALRGESSLTADAATRRFVSDILENRAVLVLSHVDGRLHDIWVTDSPEKEFDRAAPNESIECRYWSGGPWHAADRR